MRFNAVYPRLYFWLGSALVALIDAPPLKIPENVETFYKIPACSCQAFYGMLDQLGILWNA